MQPSLRQKAQQAGIRFGVWSRFLTRISYRRDLPFVWGAVRHRKVVPLPPALWEEIAPVAGFLSPLEAGLLYWAACEWPLAGPVVELGSFGGRSTIVLARAGRQVHAVDAWGAIADPALKDVNLPGMFDQFQANLRQARVADQVTVHRGTTLAVAQDWHTPAALLFVDAGHEYEAVQSDLQQWCPHLMPGGLLLLHDALGDAFLGVTRAAAELLPSGWRPVLSAGSLVGLARP